MECLKNYGWGGLLNSIGGSVQNHTHEKECKMAKWLSKEGFQIAEKRREPKGKEEMGRYTHLYVEFQRIARRDKKAFLTDQCKQIEKNNRISSVKLLSHVRLFATTWIAIHQASLSIANSWSLCKLSPLSRWCHPTISSSVISFSSCLQSFPASWSFQMSQLFTLGGQSIASASVLPMNIQDWFPLGLMGLISLQPKGLLRVYSNITVPKASILECSKHSWSTNSLVLNFLYGSTFISIHGYWKIHIFE